MQAIAHIFNAETTDYQIKKSPIPEFCWHTSAALSDALGAITDLDVCEYPDSGKINILPQREIFRKEDTVDYCEGEENVADKWDMIKR
jgi:hypothetical protein